MWFLLAACWSPDPSVAPELGPLEVAEGMADPGGEAGAEAPSDEPEAPAEPEAPEATPFDEYVAWTNVTTVSVVDDFGQPIAIIEKLATEVEVQAEDKIRKRVWCGGCTPVVEGWVQRSVVTDRGGKLPTGPGKPPPGAPRPNLPLVAGQGEVPPPPVPNTPAPPATPPPPP